MTEALCYIGTQGEGPGEGIVAARLDEESGALTLLGCVAEEERPTFTLPDQSRPLLFAVSEVGNRDDRHGAIMSYRIVDRAGTLAPIGRRRTGGGPTHLTQSANGEMLYCANFGGPEAVALPVEPTGALAPISAVQVTEGTGPHKRQSVPHPHGVTLDPTGRFLLVPDMGADRLYVYRVAGTGLTPADPPYLTLPAGCGPRFVLFGPDGRHAYLVGELSAELFQLDWDGAGGLSIAARLAMDPAEADHPPGAAAFGLSGDGRFLYVSNRGSHAMHVYGLDAETGAMDCIQTISAGGEKPWGLGISPSGRWMLVANQASGTVTCLAIDQHSGRLSSGPGQLQIKAPTSVSFLPRALFDRLAENG